MNASVFPRSVCRFRWPEFSFRSSFLKKSQCEYLQFIGTLHQHRIHHAKAWRRKGCAFPHPDRHIQREWEWRIHRAPALCFLPGQSLQGEDEWEVRQCNARPNKWPHNDSFLAQRCGQKAEDRQGEDGEEGAPGKGEVPALLWNHNPDRG